SSRRLPPETPTSASSSTGTQAWSRATPRTATGSTAARRISPGSASEPCGRRPRRRARTSPAGTTTLRSAAPSRSAELGSAVPGQPRDAGEPAQLGHRVVLRPGDEQQRAVLLADQRLQPDRKGKRLVGTVAAEGHELVGWGEPGEDVAVGDPPHRDVGDERHAVRAGHADRDRVRAGERRAAV